MTAWYKIKGNKLGWWGKYGGQGEMGENLFCDDDTWTTTSPFSTPSPPCTAAFLANGVGHRLVAFPPAVGGERDSATVSSLCLSQELFSQLAI